MTAPTPTTSFPDKIGWGHSTWQEGVRLCRQAGAKQLAIFHHNPDHVDSDMAGIEREAQAMWSGAMVSRDEHDGHVGVRAQRGEKMHRVRNATRG